MLCDCIFFVCFYAVRVGTFEDSYILSCAQSKMHYKVIHACCGLLFQINCIFTSANNMYLPQICGYIHRGFGISLPNVQFPLKKKVFFKNGIKCLLKWGFLKCLFHSCTVINLKRAISCFPLVPEFNSC